MKFSWREPDPIFFASPCPKSRFHILDAVSRARNEQNVRWKDQTFKDGSEPAKFLISIRYGELSRSLEYFNDHYKTTTWTSVLAKAGFEVLSTDDVEQLRKKLVELAAVAVGWIEDIDQRSS